MNKSIIIIILFLFFNNLNAQNENHKNILSFGLGASFLGNVQAANKQTPVINFSFDRMLNENISFGGGISYQNIKWDADYLGNPYTLNDTVDAKLSRLNLGLRVMFYYGKKYKNLKLFSGFRGSCILWDLRDNHGHKVRTDYIEGVLGLLLGGDLHYQTLMTIPIGFQIIPIGGRYYFNENFGLNLELGLVGPYFVTGGLSYKF
jgi:hypothetical protein